MKIEPKEKPWVTWPHFSLWERVHDALLAAPGYFKSDIMITGVPATDLQNLNTLLGATIEDRVVDTLNSMRSVWDPESKYMDYAFVRQPQTFPDVLLRRASDGDIVMGIELKGWYLLAKEDEPSFRFTVTREACALADLLAVFPWHFSEVISGRPKLLAPFVESARHAATARNEKWAATREKKGNGEIEIASGVKPYPTKSDAISDKPKSDSGGNFGRIARTKIMDSYLAELNQKPLSGIPAAEWRRFLRVFGQGATAAGIESAMVALETEITSKAIGDPADLLVKLRKIAKILQS